MTRLLDIRDTEQVKRVNELACTAPYEVWLSTDTVMVDARSLLGIFTLIGKQVRVVAEDDINPKHFTKLVAKMEY